MPLSYSYDKLQRLTKEEIEVNGSKVVNEYTYDSVSNRKKCTTVVGDINELVSRTENKASNTNALTGDSYISTITEGTTTYKYNDIYQLVSETNNNGTTSYSYDKNGNLLKEEGYHNMTYVYDKRNRLKSIETNDKGEIGRESYEYDYNGYRLSKKTDNEEIKYIIDEFDFCISY